MAKIEAYYLKRNSSINKDKVMKQAVTNKNQAFKMMKETTKVDARQFCRASLNDLVSKVSEMTPTLPPKRAVPDASVRDAFAARDIAFPPAR